MGCRDQKRRYIAKSQMEEEMKGEFKMPEDIIQSLPKDEAIDKMTDKKDDIEGKS